MSEATSSASSQIRYIPLLSVGSDSGTAFVQSVAGKAEPTGVVIDKGAEIRLEAIDCTTVVPAQLDERLMRADGALLLVRFMDTISLAQIKDIFRRLPGEARLPVSVLIVRENGENEFKISCMSCGQKLWVKDSDAGKSGRCPNCRKIFLIPTQDGCLRSYLMIADTPPVLTVRKGRDASCKNALAGLIERIRTREQALKGATMRVQFPTGDTNH